MSTKHLEGSGSTNFYHKTLSNTLDWSSLSPAQKYRESVRRIKAECLTENFDISSVNFKGSKVEPKEIKPPFQVEKDEISPATIGVVVVILGSASMNLDSPVSRDITLDKSKSSLLALFSGAVVVGVGAVFVGSFYRKLAEEIRTEIVQVFNQISNEAITAEQLLTSTQAVCNKKEASYFNRLFESCNPTPSCYLLLTKGIALDSSNSFQLAHQQYITCLSYAVENDLQELVCYAYARSLRLDGKKSEALFQLNKIQQTSPIYLLRQIEEALVEGNAQDLFNEDDPIPCNFKCPLTLDLMRHPVYHEVSDQGSKKCRHYFEKASIEDWLAKNKSCPITRSPLSVYDLVEDQDLVGLIHIWKQTNLKT